MWINVSISRPDNGIRFMSGQSRIEKIGPKLVVLTPFNTCRCDWCTLDLSSASVKGDSHIGSTETWQREIAYLTKGEGGGGSRGEDGGCLPWNSSVLSI